MLTKEDKQAIDACTTRPNSVWEGIKNIITSEKYTSYRISQNGKQNGMVRMQKQEVNIWKQMTTTKI